MPLPSASIISIHVYKAHDWNHSFGTRMPSVNKLPFCLRVLMEEFLLPSLGSFQTSDEPKEFSTDKTVNGLTLALHVSKVGVPISHHL